ncbi:GHKL domain-containing protein [Agarivorans sp. B2Z047]|uniref:ATP-binding protein n=1 Tax=Agarivorans sp. B2Z047 TaxID=2652721 RepID=UPI00128B6716|nr:ATP-binding protein [Agarivorans sp. B2Z047]MPW31675.1 GHKL domain-containing protein [Agarivorans sp. B2Z047]UQN42365.1 GHKL domain-containing protein [Agarivorans sp. B2Z047]
MEQRSKNNIPLRQKLLLVLAWLLLSLLAGVTAQYQAKQQQQSQLLEESQRLQRSIQHELDRFRNFPKVLAIQQQLSEPLSLNVTSQRRHALNLYLQHVNDLQGSDVTYLLDPSGTTLASSNWQSARSFVGSNYSYRPYFQTAILGKYGQYFALGSRSGIRGYYFSAPVKIQQRVVGVIVVKVALNIIDKSWRDPNFEYLLTDKHGVVFYASQAHWLYRSIKALPESLRQQLINSRQYGEHQLKNMAQDLRPNSINLPNYGGQRVDYISTNRVLPTAGWRLYALSKDSGYIGDIAEALFLSSLFYLGLVLLYLYWRQLQLSRAMQAQANHQLEERVTQRTAELTQSNQQLQQAIDDYRRTANTLKKTEDELVQAAKLATLGELSAGINHELNQPLTAMQSYAENALRFQQKQQHEQVTHNLQDIIKLTSMMSKMIAKFKIFSRKSSGQTSAVSSAVSINAALSILANRIVANNIKIEFSGQDEQWVKADAIQLEQVLINLINNAIDALEGIQSPLLGIRQYQQDNWQCIAIWDNGPMLSEEQQQRIFEPFFTTKKQGLGLGMAISKRLIESFEGELSVSNLADIGPEFVIRLRTHTPPANS